MTTTGSQQWVPEAAFNIAIDIYGVEGQIAALRSEKQSHLDRYVEQMQSLRDHDLLAAMKGLKILHGPGWTKLLEAAGFSNPSIRKLETELKAIYNDGDGRWCGAVPIEDHHPRPAPGTWVVYQLLNGDDLLYIGSTGDFRTRLNAHRRTKEFNSWRAAECDNEEDCRDLETALIDRYRPPLNRMISKPRMELT